MNTERWLMVSILLIQATLGWWIATASDQINSNRIQSERNYQEIRKNTERLELLLNERK